MVLALAAMEKILKAAGAKRVSEDAKEALREVLEAASRKIGTRATEIAEHAGRTTIKAEDIRLAARDFFV